MNCEASSICVGSSQHVSNTSKAFNCQYDGQVCRHGSPRRARRSSSETGVAGVDVRRVTSPIFVQLRLSAPITTPAIAIGIYLHENKSQLRWGNYQVESGDRIQEVLFPQAKTMCFYMQPPPFLAQKWRPTSRNAKALLQRSLLPIASSQAGSLKSNPLLLQRKENGRISIRTSRQKSDEHGRR